MGTLVWIQLPALMGPLPNLRTRGGRRRISPFVGPKVQSPETLQDGEEQFPPLHRQREGKGSVIWCHVDYFCVTHVGKLKLVKIILIGRLSNGNLGEQFSKKLRDVPLKVDEGHKSSLHGTI